MKIISHTFTHYILLCSMAIAMLVMSACSKDEQFTTDRSAVLTFSEDSIKFDTLFGTTIGSKVRETLMIYNRNDNGVRLKNVKLENAAGHWIRMNLDGPIR